MNLKNKTKLVLFKFLQILIVLLVASFATFLLTHFAPGEPGISMYEAAGIIPTEEMLEATRVRYGLDKPFFVQYFVWIGNCLKGDFGQSFSMHEDVLVLIMRNLSSTLKLALYSLSLTMIISVPLGIYTAVKKNKVVDYLVRMITFIGGSAPNFLVALILTYVFAYKLNLLPVLASQGTVKAMILPIITLAIGMSAKFIRQIRAFVLEELSQDYVYGARARGLSETNILFKHVMRNVMLPLVTLVSLSLSSLLGGVAIVETIFSYQGLGKIIVYAVTYRDYPLIQGFVLWTALTYTLINVGTDGLYYILDPRLKKSLNKESK